MISDGKTELVFELHAQICQAIGHPKRMQILELLREGERCVCKIGPALGMRQANVSQHLSILRAAGVVLTRREGVWIHYRVADPRIFTALDLMRELIAARMGETHALIEAWRDAHPLDQAACAPQEA